MENRFRRWRRFPFKIVVGLSIANVAFSARASSPDAPKIKTPSGELTVLSPIILGISQSISCRCIRTRIALSFRSATVVPAAPGFRHGLERRPQRHSPTASPRPIRSRVPVKFDYADESDPGPYPIPAMPIEGGEKLTAIATCSCWILQASRLNELLRGLHARPTAGMLAWGAVFDLESTNCGRPVGLRPTPPGCRFFRAWCVYDEAVEKKERGHALRFTVVKTQRGYILPAQHWASSSSDPNRPPMGLRLRLKAGFDVSHFPPEDQVILRALKTYGMILADNGGDWFISGAPDKRWNDDNLHLLGRVKGRDFEAVDTGPIVTK